MEFLASLQQYLPQIVIFTIVAMMIYFGHRSKDHDFSIFDYITDPATKKASITRTLQVIAGLTATWIVVKRSVAGDLTTEMFAIYLGAMGISEAWSKFIGAKYIKKDEKDESV